LKNFIIGFVLLTCRVFANHWTPGAIISHGASTGIFHNFNGCVYDPSTGQLVQTWLDAGAGHALYAAAFNGSSWTTQIIPYGSSVGLDRSTEFYSPVYDPGSGRLIQIWQDTGNSLLYYSLFNGTSWTDGALLPRGASNGYADFNVPVYCNSINAMVLTWEDSVNNDLYYSIYDGVTWSAGRQIPPGISSGTNDFFLNPIFMPSTGQMVQIWVDATTNLLIYSAFNGENWTSGAEIPPSTATSANSFNAPIYDPASGQLILTWTDQVSGLLFGSSFNGSSWVTEKIPFGTSTGVANFFPSPAYIPTLQQVMQLWQDSGSGHFAYSSFFNGSNWTVATQVPPGASTQHVGASFSYDNATGQIVQIWPDLATSLIYYSVYNGSAWEVAQLLPLGSSTGLRTGLGPVYDPATGQLVQIWQDLGSGHFLYSSSFNRTWTPGVPIALGTSPSVAIGGFNVPFYMPSTGQLILIWLANGFLYYSTY